MVGVALFQVEANPLSASSFATTICAHPFEHAGQDHFADLHGPQASNSACKLEYTHTQSYDAKHRPTTSLSSKSQFSQGARGIRRFPQSDLRLFGPSSLELAASQVVAAKPRRPPLLRRHAEATLAGVGENGPWGAQDSARNLIPQWSLTLQHNIVASSGHSRVIISQHIAPLPW